MRNGKREAKWHTLQDGKVKPHPSSVNSFVAAFPSRWLVYNDKVKSSDIFIRDSSCISDYALLLFGPAPRPPQAPALRGPASVGRIKKVRARLFGTYRND